MVEGRRSRIPERAIWGGASAVLLVLAAGPLAAQQADRSQSASAFAGFDYSDNMSARRRGDSGSLVRAGLDADLNGSRRRLNYSLSGNISWAEYSSSDLAGALEGAFSGILNLGAPEGPFGWTFRDTIHQSMLVAQGNSTPDNSEFVNTFSTGPSVTLGLGGRAAISLSSHFTRITYQESPFDSDSLSATAGVSLSMPAGGSVGLYGNATGTTYDNDELVDPDYDFRQVYLRYLSGALSNTYLSLDAGYAESDNAGTVAGGPLLRLALERRFSTASAFNVSATRVITNAAELRGAADAGPAAQDNPASALGAAEATSVDVGLVLAGRRNTLSLSGGWREEGYKSASQFDRDVTFVGASFGRRMRSTLTGSLSILHRAEDFADPAVPRFSYQTVQLEMAQRIGRRLTGVAAISYSHRSDEERTQFEFTEWRFGMKIDYLLAGPGL